LKGYIRANHFTEFEEKKVMNRMFIVAGFIVLVVGGLVYTLLPYTSTMHYDMQSNEHPTEYTYTTTTTGNSPLGAVVMFIGFTIVVVGLFYKPEVVKAPEIEQQNPQ